MLKGRPETPISLNFKLLNIMIYVISESFCPMRSTDIEIFSLNVQVMNILRTSSTASAVSVISGRVTSQEEPVIERNHCCIVVKRETSIYFSQ